jgi:hypothetical protein
MEAGNVAQLKLIRHLLMHMFELRQHIAPADWDKFHYNLVYADPWTPQFGSQPLLPRALKFLGLGVHNHWLKLWSHYGEVRGQYFGDGHGRDVGNWSMHWLMRSTWPDLSEALVQLNMESLADLIEAFFGVLYWKRRFQQSIPANVVQVEDLLSKSLRCVFDLWRNGFRNFDGIRQAYDAINARVCNLNAILSVDGTVPANSPISINFRQF